jgi:hypothetical protein
VRPDLKVLYGPVTSSYMGHNNLQTLLLEVVSESFGTMTTRDQRSYASTSQSGHPIQQFWETIELYLFRRWKIIVWYIQVKTPCSNQGNCYMLHFCVAVKNDVDICPI